MFRRLRVPQSFAKGLLFALGVMLGGPGPADRAQAQSKWLRGPELQKQLDSPAMVVWHEVPFAQALGRIRDNYRVPLLLGRAVDPQRPMQLAASGSVRLLVEEAVEYYNRTHCRPESYPRPAMRLGVSFFDQGVYVGSEPLARGFRTLLEHRREEIQRLPLPLRRQLLQARPWSWPELTSPRELLDQLAAEAQVKLVHVEQLPHDLWRAGEFPATPWYVRVSLVLVQFEATFEVDPTARRVVLRRIHEGDLTMQKLYPAGPRPEERIAQWKKWCPRATFAQQGRRIAVTGTWEDHQRIAAGGHRRTRTTRRGIQLYTLRVLNKPVREVVPLLARQLELQLQWSPDQLAQAGVKLDQRISLLVEDVTREELFRTLLEPLGMKFRIGNRTLTITPAGDKPPP